MQVPGRHNALGKIKFLFPNGYSVYIHDTPSKNLFFRNVRAFSHGCMRIQKPRELLESLALFNDNINVDDVMNQLKGTEKKTIVLKHKVPIDITYLTAYIDPYGYLNFRKDVYHYDKYQMKNYTPKVVSLSEKGAASAGITPAPKPKAASRNNVLKTGKVLHGSKNTPVRKKLSGPKQTPKKSRPQKKPASQKTKAKIPSASEMLTAAHRSHRRVDGDGYRVTEVY